MMRHRRAVQFIAASLRGDVAAAPRGDDDWVAILGVANAHLLGPALGVALARAGRGAALPTDVRDYLAMLTDLNRARNVALRAQAIEMIGALNAAGMRPMLLKGAIALFSDIYGDGGGRMIGDLDLMVPQADVAAALQVLSALGYRLETAYHPVQHAVGEFVRDNDPGAIDLHVELIDASYLLPAAGVWIRARLRERGGVAFFVPSPGDMILHNLLHTQIHHGANFYRGVVELRQLYEFVLLAQHHAPAIDWDAIERHLARHRLATLLGSYAVLAGRLFGLPWPLPAPPRQGARLHAARCRLELDWPRLQALAAPWANLRFAFSGHRMRDLYPQGRMLAVTRLRHAGRFLRKSNAREFVWRLFRPQ